MFCLNCSSFCHPFDSVARDGRTGHLHPCQHALNALPLTGIISHTSSPLSRSPDDTTLEGTKVGDLTLYRRSKRHDHGPVSRAIQSCDWRKTVSPSANLRSNQLPPQWVPAVPSLRKGGRSTKPTNHLHSEPSFISKKRYMEIEQHTARGTTFGNKSNVPSLTIIWATF